MQVIATFLRRGMYATDILVGELSLEESFLESEESLILDYSSHSQLKFCSKRNLQNNGTKKTIPTSDLNKFYLKVFFNKL